MPARRTHRGVRVAQSSVVRNRWGWLCAVLGVYGVSGCTTGLAEPIIGPDGGVSKTAGRGVGAGGRGGRGGNEASNPICAGIAVPTGPDLAAEEDRLGESLNVGVSKGDLCDGMPLMHAKFVFSDNLRCASRSRAQWEWSSMVFMTTSRVMPRPALPSGAFQSSISHASRSADAWLEIRRNSRICSALQSSSYSKVGIGHYDNFWAITLAPSD
jgi:hypothetical protein